MAAHQGEASAQNRLGYMYDVGQDVAQDYVEAATWYKKAADQGVAEALLGLGIMYSLGHGVPQNYGEAARLFRSAADQGDAKPQTLLGLMYAEGQGVAQDHVLAHMWLNLAATQGDEGAAFARDIVWIMMTPAQIAEAEKLAREWKPNSSSTARAPSMRSLS